MNSTRAVKRSSEVCQRSEFSCCYIVPIDDGYELNAHHYKFEATVGLKSDLDFDFSENPRIISFEEFKSCIDDVLPDKQFLYTISDLNQQILARDFNLCGVSLFEFNSEVSAETLLYQISIMLERLISNEYPHIYLKETKLRESNNSFVTWKQEEI